MIYFVSKIIDMKIFSAPLQGYTESAWRNAHEKVFGNVDAYFAPFTRLEKGTDYKLPIRNKDLRDIDPQENSVDCIVPQVLASHPDEFMTLVDIIAERGYKWIDINFGCPFPMISKRHKGCGILPYPQEVQEIMNATERYPDIDFSVKMRLGAESNDEWREILPILNDTKLKMVTIHPRTGKQQYKGDVDMNSFDAFANECKHKLVYNGNITEASQIGFIKEKYPSVYGVMIGRGLLGKPYLALEYNHGKLDEDSQRKMIIQMHDEIYNVYAQRLQGDSQLLGKMHAFWEYMLPYIDKKVGKELKKSGSIARYQQALNNYKLQY